jgi:hypothetical protein
MKRSQTSAGRGSRPPAARFSGVVVAAAAIALGRLAEACSQLSRRSNPLDRLLMESLPSKPGADRQPALMAGRRSYP